MAKHLFLWGHPSLGPTLSRAYIYVSQLQLRSSGNAVRGVIWPVREFKVIAIGMKVGPGDTNRMGYVMSVLESKCDRLS